MARSLLVAPAAEGVGLARTCLGLLRALDRRGVKVAFVKPVAQPRADGGPDRSAARVTAIMALRPPEPLTTAELEQQLGEGGLDVNLSRGALVDDIIYTIALTAIQARAESQRR
jgi:phosphate acetyltransferase